MEPAASNTPKGAEVARVTYVRRLDELAREDGIASGHKAANLAVLAARGFPVPPGVVVPAGVPDDRLEAAVSEAISVLGAVPVAVRSSALAEDLEGASFAGQYETVLGVQGHSAVLEAMRTVRETANDERVAVYRQSHGPEGAAGVAVLVQWMVAAEVSGVAFTAHPLTGVREETVITAARGLGEAVVSGEAAGEQWVVSGGNAVRDRRAPTPVLTEDQALAVAALARRVEDAFDGVPQDIEWAFAEGELHLLQARPMTALPDPVSWESPLPGGWTRIFRIGEWLPEPVTPLCDTWLLTRMEERYAARVARYLGVPMKMPLHVTINGWYFHSPAGSGSMWGQMIGILRKPEMLWSVLRSGRPEIGDRLVCGPEIDRWKAELLPRYRSLVDQHTAAVESADDTGLCTVIDEIAGVAGEYLQSISMVAGNAWKVEGVLARFYARHLRPILGGSHQTLVSGLEQPRPLEAHAIQSLDWFRPTVGELGMGSTAPRAHTALVEERQRAEAACRAQLSAPRPRRACRGRLLPRTRRDLRERVPCILGHGAPHALGA